MVAIDLKDAYLQIPIHPQSLKFLGFTGGGRAWQFKVLCLGLSTLPQVFTRVMAPISGFLHCLGAWRWGLLRQPHVPKFHQHLSLLRLSAWRFLAFCDDFLLSLGPMVSLPPPCFSNSIVSTVPLATSSPFGSSQCRLAFGHASFPVFWGEFSCLSHWVSELLSVASRSASFVSSFLSFCMKEPCLWWRLLSHSDLRTTLATWLPFGTSLGFAWSFDSFGSKVFLSDGVSLWDEFRSGGNYICFLLLALSYVSFSG